MEAARRWLRKWWRVLGASAPSDTRRLNYVTAMNWQAKLWIFAGVMVPASLGGRVNGLSTTQAVLGAGGAIAMPVAHYLASILPARRRLRRLGLDPDDLYI